MEWSFELRRNRLRGITNLLKRSKMNANVVLVLATVE